MAKSKGGSKNLTKKIKPAIASVAGGIAANFAAAKVLTKVSTNPKVQYGILAALGIYLTTMREEMVSNAGMGMTTVALMKLAGTFVPELAGVTGIESDLINGLYDDTITEEDMNGIINGLADDDDSVGDGDDY